MILIRRAKLSRGVSAVLLLSISPGALGPCKRTGSDSGCGAGPGPEGRAGVGDGAADDDGAGLALLPGVGGRGVADGADCAVFGLSLVAGACGTGADETAGSTQPKYSTRN